MNKKEIKAFRRSMNMRPINALFSASPFQVAQTLAGGLLFATAFFVIFTIAGIFN